MKRFEAKQMWHTFTLAGSFVTLLVLGACSQTPELAPAAHDNATHVSTATELRAAVADPAVDAIFVEAGTYFIPTPFYEVALAVNRDLTITGAGQEATLLQAGVVEEGYESYEYDTLLEVLSGTVLVSDMTIRPSGSCIRNKGTLTLKRVKIVGCMNQGNSLIENIGGNLTLSESTVTEGNNLGQIISNDYGGVLDITNSVIANNYAYGETILNYGALSITASKVTNNRDGAGGEGTIRNDASTVVTDSVISGNTGAQNGGAIGSDGSLVIRNSTISNNTSHFSGAITSYGELVLENSTVSGNTAITEGEGTGGGVTVGGTATISHSTITDNQAGFIGGGIVGGTNVSLSHSIVAGNRAPEGPDVSSTITSLGYNLIGNSTNNNSFVNGQNGDQVGTEAAPLDPGLRPLRNNGGPTPTHALAATSPAVNAGDPSFSSPPATDQRGEARVFNGRIDIGAFELTAVGASDDGDGVEAAIDGRYENGAFVDESTVASSSFTDQHLGGTTYGTLSGPVGDFAGSVKDINGAVGVVLSVQSGTIVQGGIASRSVVMCGGDYTILLDAGDTVEATCGSLLAKVISGNVDITLSNSAVVSAPQGATAFINKQNSGSFTVENRSSNRTITVTYQGERTSVAPGESANTAPQSDLYTVTFDGVPTGQVISSVKLGNGIVSDSGADTDNLYFYARRSDKGGNTAMVTGSRRELIISKDGRSQASYTRGGNILFSFARFGSGKVTVKTLDVTGVTTAGGTVEVFDGRTRIKQVAVPKTGTSGRATLTIEAENVNILRVYLKGVGRVDDIVFEVAKP